VKILWQDVWPEVHPQSSDLKLVWDTIKNTAKRVVRPDTEVTIRHVDKSCGSPTFAYLEMLNKTSIVNNIIKAEREGYDAAIMGCCGDPGILETRQAVSIPVTAPSESAMLLAQMLGCRFAIVAVGKEVIPALEAHIYNYGFSNRAIRSRPVRSFEYWDVMIECLKSGQPKKLLADFEKVANELIQDGADVIIAGCAYLGPVLTKFGYNQVGNTGVPVIDPCSAALKMAETLVDLQKNIGLRRSTSLTSIYAPAPKEMLDQVREAFGFR
jgi:allantoin racemase